MFYFFFYAFLLFTYSVGKVLRLFTLPPLIAQLASSKPLPPTPASYLNFTNVPGLSCRVSFLPFRSGTVKLLTRHHYNFYPSTSHCSQVEMRELEPLTSALQRRRSPI